MTKWYYLRLVIVVSSFLLPFRWSSGISGGLQGNTRLGNTIQYNLYLLLPILLPICQSLRVLCCLHNFFDRPFFFLLFLLLLLFLHYLFPDICPQTATHFSRCRSYISFLHDIFSDFYITPLLMLVTLCISFCWDLVPLSSVVLITLSCFLLCLPLSSTYIISWLKAHSLFYKVPNSRPLEI